jgi:hypothetical protein
MTMKFLQHVDNDLIIINFKFQVILMIPRFMAIF